MEELDRELIKIVPSARQLAHQQLEFYAFIHFGINTVTGREWGDGTENPASFHPDRLDADQWVGAVKAAGMKGLILTCKHHDGFCLWPSRYTKHTVAASPYREGKGDIVREVSQACKRGGLQFGIYLSPWDRNQETYGFGEVYNDFFVNQLTELLTGYGEIFSVWFDGACGEGSNGKKQKYDWERYYSIIREFQSGACISVCGPDIRWCGNEAGDTRPSEWSVVPGRTSETETIAEKSQQKDHSAFRERKITAADLDLGSRKVLADEKDFIWYPAEVNTSIRPGWFYHKEEDKMVRSLSELLSIYYSSVGGNAAFLLNIPPTGEGLIYEKDVERLKELGDSLKNSFYQNLLLSARLSSDCQLDGFGIEQVREDSYETYFRTEDKRTACVIDLQWDMEQTVRYIVLKENITLSQRIEQFKVTAEAGSRSVTLYEGTVVGYKRIIPLSAVKTGHIRIHILDARIAPTLSFIGVY
ncbi:alpha-L-fucosidase [Anaerocolumna xylanovorans]|uniref:alpha-L-fucosidase n=1 Tax=Anaerocolumna xylanovorans DSM 12503 TaxID=1121345 RepID=A0A1M7YKT0_9FIRM|nr:alpha-L-fucosidase [Anaerocolumna xylanovorans]SHO53223.1 alpha-L-fucosidase [Anaerocolumna xylanovorans DSM 12503]